MKINFLVISYFLVLFIGGNFAQGILYADFYLPIFLCIIFFFKNLNFISTYLKFVIAILVYGLIFGLISIVHGINDFFYVAVFLLRFLSFGVMLCFGLMHFEKIICLSKYYLPIILLVVFFYSINNYLIGYREHYSYVTIPSTWSPAASSFVLSCIGLFGLLIHHQIKKTDSKVVLFSSVSLCALALLTFTNSAFGSLIGVLCFWMFLSLTYRPSSWKVIAFSIALVIILVLIQPILDFFWRLNWILFNLEYRFNKASSISDSMCGSIWCIFFGSGPGSHSFINGNTYGQSSILAFDQLHTRIFLEWGLFGSFLWLLFFLKILFISLDKISLPILNFLLFGILFGIGSEFIFEAYSGQLYGLLLGSILGSYRHQYYLRGSK